MRAPGADAVPEREADAWPLPATTTLLNLARIRNAPVRSSPYPFFIATGALFAGSAGRVAADFPRITKPGAIAVEDTDHGALFANLLDELRGEGFRQLIADKLDLDLDGKDLVINVRGQTRWTDGNIHTDTPSKLVTVLLYFNAPGAAVNVTGLRILRSGNDIDDFAEEVPPLLGTMVVFKVTPNCWHGFKPFAGERHSLQLNYLSGLKVTGKHEGLRRLRSHAGRTLGRLVGR